MADVINIFQEVISNLMEYGYSGTIIALVGMSALLFFPYTLE